jgi:hypothetical protein
MAVEADTSAVVGVVSLLTTNTSLLQVYTGTKDGEVNTTVKICDDLVTQAELTDARGRVLYTDNYYTSMALAKHFFEKYRWTITGTFTPSDKKAKSDEDFPFRRLSRGAKDSVKRGWKREAVIKMKTPTGKVYYIQATTWRDKKQVCFLSTNEVGFSDGSTVKRHTRRKATRDTIDSPRARDDYAEFFNAVDRNDRDSYDYSTSIRTNRYYLRIFCWGLDRIIHCLYIVVVELAKLDLGLKVWKRYSQKNGGRKRFQVDLGIALLNYGIELEWDDENRPRWMRQSEFVPCDCKSCFFCLKGMTCGVEHRRKKGRQVTIQYACGSRRRTNKCTTDRVLLKLKNGEDMKYADFCEMCMRQQAGSDLSFNVKKTMCRKSKFGCAQCQERICNVCWPNYDRHQQDNGVNDS